jgi:hypothetical protein
LSTLWREILAELATREQRTLVRAFVTMLQEKLGRGGNGGGIGWLIGEVVGSLSKDDEVSNILIDHVLRKDAYYSQAMSSVLVRWIQACDRKLSSDNSRVMMLEKVIEGWTDLGSIKNGSDASRFCKSTRLEPWMVLTEERRSNDSLAPPHLLPARSALLHSRPFPLYPIHSRHQRSSRSPRPNHTTFGNVGRGNRL